MTERARGQITDDMVAELHSRIGQPVRSSEEPHLYEASRDAIRHWARATGDRDPKWTDEAYARTTPFGGIIAPPSMIYAFSPLAIGDRGGMPGVQSFFGGADHEWLAPIHCGDSITSEAVLLDIVDKSNDRRRMYQQISEVTYFNARHEIVARTRPWGMRMERASRARKDAAAGEAPEDRTQPPADTLASYSDDDIARLMDWYGSEPGLAGGEKPRFWEDVAVGDEIPSIIRGPWSTTSSVMFLGALGSGFLKAHGYWYDYLSRHPRVARRDARGVPESPARSHWDSGYAQSIGLPGAHDTGPERIAWMATMCTYFCGDEGWLRDLHVEVRGFNVIGDLTTLGGQITSKDRLPDGTALVRADLWARNQRGETTASGNATLSLPSRTETA